MSCGHDILYGSRRITTAAIQTSSRQSSRDIFIAQLDHFADDWPVFHTADDCAWAIREIFVAASEYVATAGALPFDHPDNVYRLMETDDLPESSLIDGMGFLGGQPILVQTSCYEVEKLTQKIFDDVGQRPETDSPVPRAVEEIRSYFRNELSTEQVERTCSVLERYFKTVEAAAKWS